jgi:hypothetical protein
VAEPANMSLIHFEMPNVIINCLSDTFVVLNVKIFITRYSFNKPDKTMVKKGLIF